MAQTITVGKSRNVTFIPIDQNGNPNPVGPDGLPLQVVGIPTWTTEDPAPPTRRLKANANVAGFTLTPAADGLSCNVMGVTAGTVAVLICNAVNGNGDPVFGSADIEAITEQGPVLVISSLSLQFGPEV